MDTRDEKFIAKLTNSPELQREYQGLLTAVASRVSARHQLYEQHNTKFVVKMSLLPNSRCLEVCYLTPNGVAWAHAGRNQSDAPRQHHPHHLR